MAWPLDEDDCPAGQRDRHQQRVPQRLMPPRAPRSLLRAWPDGIQAGLLRAGGTSVPFPPRAGDDVTSHGHGHRRASDHAAGGRHCEDPGLAT